MSRPALCLAALLILLAPFGEGGRAPWSLLALHTLTALFCLAIAWRAPAHGGWRLPGPGAARLLTIGALFTGTVAILSATGAGYPYAAALGLIDRWVIVALFVAAVGLSMSDGECATLRNLVVASSSLQAVVGLVRGIGGSVADAGAEFLNPNHMAAFLNIGLFCCAAVLSRPPARIRTALFWGGLTLLHIAAIVRLESRGALLGMLGGGLLLLVVRWRDFSPRARRIAAESLLLVTLVGGVTLALRFMRAEDPFRYYRLSIWRASTVMIAQEPLLGHGPGMFGHLSSSYNFPLEEAPIRYGRRFYGAHSTFLTLAAEDGVPAALVALSAVLLAIALLARRRMGDREVPLGVATALGALLVQGMVEDLLERPAFGIIMALLVGSAAGSLAGAAPSGAPAGGRPAGAPDSGHRPMIYRLAVSTLALVAWIGVVLLPFLSHREASAARAGGRGGLARMERAAWLNPYQPEYQHDLAMAAINQGQPDASAYAFAMEHLAAAARLKPIDSRFPLMMARLEARLGTTLFEDPHAGERAARLYREAVRLAPLDPRPRLEQAGHLDELGQPEEALESLRRALELEPNFRRAHLLQVLLLVRLGRREEAGAAWEALAETDAVLAGYHPDSSYAVDLTRDAPRERERLLALLADEAVIGAGERQW